jgi:hypothetical protein
LIINAVTGFPGGLLTLAFKGDQGVVRTATNPEVFSAAEKWSCSCPLWTGLEMFLAQIAGYGLSGLPAEHRRIKRPRRVWPAGTFVR